MKSIKKKPAKKKPELDRIPDGRLVIGLDVSSTAAGWAVGYREGNTTKITDFGVVSPPKHWDATKRIAEIIDHVVRICKRHEKFNEPRPRIIMEWQSHLRAAGNRTANGLAILGKSQGAVWWALKSESFIVDHVSERIWTKVNGWPAPKKDRAKMILLAVPDYRQAVESDHRLDVGLDIADAIGLTLYRLSV